MPFLYHPICHLINGERLYYVFVASRMNVRDSAQCIDTCMNLVPLRRLKGSFCTYLTFGENDIIIRMWAQERDFANFLSELRNRKREGIDQITVYIMDSMSTWYQREIEATPEWPNKFAPDNVQDLIARNPLPSYFARQYQPLTSREDNVFLLDLNEPYSKDSNLFSELTSSVAEEDQRFQTCFKGIQRISVYSYRCKTHKGVLIKGQTGELSAIAQVTRKVSELFSVDSTVTHICFGKLPLDRSGDAISERVFNERHTEVIYNLLKAYDCYNKVLDSDALARKDAFCAHLVSEELFRSLFTYRSDWWSSVSEVHKLFRWVTFGKNGTLTDYLRGCYVDYEAYFDDILKDLRLLEVDDDKPLLRSMRKQIPSVLRRKEAVDIDEAKLKDFAKKIKSFFHTDPRRMTGESYVTFGEIPRLLGSLTKLVHLAPDESAAIRDIVDAISACVENRNRLMHRPIDLFAFDQYGTYVWKDYAVNLIKLNVAFQHHKTIFENLVAKIRASRISLSASSPPLLLKTINGAKVEAGAPASQDEDRSQAGAESLRDKPILQREFKIGLSFSDHEREYVEEVANILADKFGEDNVFYDRHFEAVLARQNVAMEIIGIFLDRCDLGVAFASTAYIRTDWCMREWSAMLAKSRKRGGKKKDTMIICFEDVDIPGHRSEIDGHVEVGQRSPAEIAELIIQRYESEFNGEGVESVP